MNDAKRAIEIISDRQKSRAAGLCIVSSEKILQEALDAGCKIKYLLCTAGFAGSPDCEGRFTVKENIIRKITGVKAGRGFAAAVYRKEKERALSRDDNCVLLDRIQDPANMGAIIRSGFAFGFDSYLLENCADPFLEKTVRASAGAVFKCSFFYDGTEQAERLVKKGALLVCTDVKSGAAPAVLREKKGLILAFGNEGGGVSDKVRSMAGVTVRIDCPGKFESLNVAAAAAILFYEAGKKKGTQK